MGLRFRRSVKIGKYVRLNFNKGSFGLTAGVKGAHVSLNSKGRRTTSVGIPGTGLSYVKTSSAKSHKSTSAKRSSLQSSGSTLTSSADLVPHNPNKIRAGNKDYKPETLKKISNFLLICGAIVAFFGIVLIPVGGVVFLIIGIVEIFFGLSYQKAVKNFYSNK
ncbi:MAG TPA: DUF4236 domain-containing protein [Oscillospiraceae bacterium]|nr:DUF4236 domain-containing protein [Oscillospiraceae bacterium]